MATQRKEWLQPESDAPLLRVAPMRYSDLGQVMEIERVSFPTPWSRSLYEREILNWEKNSIAVVGRRSEGGPVVAHAVWWLVADECHLATLAVEPTNRGRGLGDAMLRACLYDAIRRDLNHVVLEVRYGNNHAQALYEKYGFRTIALRKNYYQETGEDALVMLVSPVPEISVADLEVAWW